MVFATTISVPYPRLMALCDRPGCSEPVFLHYGFDPVAAVVWLELPRELDASGLCETHAERLVAPRGWTIDDRRDPTLRLFRPGPSNASASSSRKKPFSRKSHMTQTELFETSRSSEVPTENSLHASKDSPDVSSLSSDTEQHGPPLTPLLSRAFRGTRLESD